MKQNTEIISKKFHFTCNHDIRHYAAVHVPGLLLPDPADVKKALFNADDSKSSGDELDSKEEVCSRSGTDDAAERGSDSTRDEFSAESDMDSSAALKPKNRDVESETAAGPVPKPRRRKGVLSIAGPPEDKANEVKPVPKVENGKQKKVAQKRQSAVTAHRREKGTDWHAWRCIQSSLFC